MNKYNYRKLNKTITNKVWFVFVDADNMSAPIIDELGIKVNKEMVHMDYVPYSIKFTKIPIQKEEDFESAMEKLKKKLLLMGYSSYEEKSSEIFQTLKI